MKITIIREDGAVYKDRLSYSSLDLSIIPSNVHAVQFNDVSNVGWIEFTQDDFGVKEANQTITSLPTWAVEAMTKWDEAKTAEEAKAAKEAEETAANQPQTTGIETA